MTTIERLLVVVLLAMSEQQLLGRELLAAKAAVKAMQLQHVLTKSDFAFKTGNAADVAIVGNADFVDSFHMLGERRRK